MPFRKVMDSNALQDNKVRMVVASTLILGILIGLSLADIVFDDYQTGLGDKDGDNVPDLSLIHI